jgi:hypothetical protein
VNKAEQGDTVVFDFDGKTLTGYVEQIDFNGWLKIVEGNHYPIGDVYWMPPNKVRVLS